MNPNNVVAILKKFVIYKRAQCIPIPIWAMLYLISWDT